MRREIPIPGDLASMDEVIAYTRGYEDAMEKLGVIEFSECGDPGDYGFKGGQGRNADEVEDQARIVGWLLVAFVVFVVVCVIVAVLCSGKPS